MFTFKKSSRPIPFDEVELKNTDDKKEAANDEITHLIDDSWSLLNELASTQMIKVLPMHNHPIFELTCHSVLKYNFSTATSSTCHYCF